MKVLITGGSGFLGINLVRHLLEKNKSIKTKSKKYEIAVLDIAPFDYPEKDQITFIKADIRNLGSLIKAFKGQDQIVHTAAALPLYSKKDIFSTEVKGTRNVMEAAKQNKIKTVVHISSTAVYGVPDHHPIYEHDKKIGVGPYGKAKIRAEKVALEYRESGMNVPIIRPKSFIGKERLGVFALLYDWAKTGHNFPLLGNGKNKYQLLDVEDLSEAIYLCLTKPKKIANDTFNVGAQKFGSLKTDFQAVLKHAGFKKRIIMFPAAPAIVVLKILEALKLSPLYEWVYETAYRESFVDVSKIEKQLGFTPKYSNKDALIRNYDWYVENEKNFKNSSGISHRVPWKQGALRFLKVFFK